MNKFSSLKERLKNGDKVLGTFHTIPSASLANVIGCSGLDFIVIDCEHGPMNMETAENIVRAAQVSGMDSIIRLPANEAHLILRALDIGPQGIQIPHVSNKNDAEKIVKDSKYWPQGDRGYTPFTRAGQYGLDPANHAKEMNKNTLVVLNVEGNEGLENLEEIIKVDGVDVVFIGPYDLSQAFGCPGEVDSKEVVDAIKKTVALTNENGVACGSFARDFTYLDILIDCGVQYITYGVDSNLMLKTYKDVIETFMQKING